MSFDLRSRKYALGFAQRQTEYGAGGFHAGQGSCCLQDLLNENGALSARVAIGGYIKQESQHMIGAESGIDMLQAIEAVQEQPGAGQQHNCDCQLQGDEHAAEADASGPRAGPSPVRAENAVQIEAGSLNSWRESEEHAGHKCNEEREA